jgi:hypothetical protein
MSARRSPAVQWLLPVTVAALGAVLAAQSVGRDPRYIAPLLAVVALMAMPAVLGRWRMRKLLISGDVERVLGTWQGSIERVPHRDTMAPLLQATAYAAYGWIEAGRRALKRALRGPAWEAALEQRLFVETLLDAFEGDRDGAVRKASALEALPMPAAGMFARRRITTLRRGLSALTRAFAHSSRDGDARALARAAGASPLVHWAMRYAAAIVAVDRGRPNDVQNLLLNAPPWPKESAFREYHGELLERVGQDPLEPAH